MFYKKEEAIEYLQSFGSSKKKLGLERTKTLLQCLGEPQKNLKFVHVTGSNGKGSTCAFLAKIMEYSGYKTGLFTSPHIEQFTERIQINGVQIPGDRLVALTNEIERYAASLDEKPSQFELITAIGIKYFSEEKCDLVILEVGMGGAFDSTNAIDAPEVCVFTNIGLEHTQYLGNTLEEIATTKGGIIKTGSTCVCYDGKEEVIYTISRICDSKDVPFVKADFKSIESLSFNLDGQDFRYKGNEYHISLIGTHQLKNAATCLEIVNVLRDRNWVIPHQAVYEGLSDTTWLARMEVLSKNPVFILDGGHNPQCAEALVSSLKQIYPGDKLSIIIGILADKDYKQVIDIIRPVAKRFYCLTPGSDRALSGKDLAEYLKTLGEDAVYVSNSKKAIDLALRESEGKAVVAFGSLYEAGEIRQVFRGIEVK